MPPELLLVLSVALGVVTVIVVILNERNSPRLARVRTWPAPVRALLALALCAAVGFTISIVISIPLAFLGVSKVWAIVLGLLAALVYVYWRDLREWWRSR